MKKGFLACCRAGGIGGALIMAWMGFSMLTATPVGAESAPANTIRVTALSPVDGQATSGNTTLKARVTGALPGAYDLFWSVDSGTWNRMNTDPIDPTVGTATIDLSGWKWRADNLYTITFTARPKNGAAPVQTSARLQVLPNLANKQDQPLLANLYLNPKGQVRQAALDWATKHPGDAAPMNHLASQPMVEWYGGWNADVRRDVDEYVSAATTAGDLPSLVIYNIPLRDCGGWSAGGANNADAYKDWVQAVANGIGDRKALVIVEPDALASMDCLSEDDRKTRVGLLGNAVHLLHTQTQASIYVDAGHARWQSAETMAKRLTQANIGEATGFSLNVSNFIGTKDNIEYGIAISKRIANKHFVVDTSRNGNGPTSDDQWCNPTGRALGLLPTTLTNQAFVDAYLWVKGPGGSDGSCGESQGGTSAPRAGEWWPQYALSLLRQAGW